MKHVEMPQTSNFDEQIIVFNLESLVQKSNERPFGENVKFAISCYEEEVKHGRRFDSFPSDEETRREMARQLSPLIQCAAYGMYGIAPYRWAGEPLSVNQRLVHVVRCMEHAWCAVLSDHWHTDEAGYIWATALARSELDFDGRLPLNYLALLARVDEGEIKIALTLGRIRLGDDGCVSAAEALDWLNTQRRFHPSRWLDPDHKFIC